MKNNLDDRMFQLKFEFHYHYDCVMKMTLKHHQIKANQIKS